MGLVTLNGGFGRNVTVCRTSNITQGFKTSNQLSHSISGHFSIGIQGHFLLFGHFFNNNSVKSLFCICSNGGCTVPFMEDSSFYKKAAADVHE